MRLVELEFPDDAEKPIISPVHSTAAPTPGICFTLAAAAGSLDEAYAAATREPGTKIALIEKKVLKEMPGLSPLPLFGLELNFRDCALEAFAALAALAARNISKKKKMKEK